MVLTAIKKVILVSSFFFISVNEMITIDNESCIFVQCYVVVGWK